MLYSQYVWGYDMASEKKDKLSKKQRYIERDIDRQIGKQTNKKNRQMKTKKETNKQTEFQKRAEEGKITVNI